MKRKLLPLLLLWCLPAFGAIHTLVWCPVTPGSGYIGVAYQVCIETTPPGKGCAGMLDDAWTTSYVATLPDNADAWIRVRAEGLNTSLQTVYSTWSNPVQIIAGLTPPAIGGCP